MPFDLPAVHVLPLLESRDGLWAIDARSAWEWRTASGESPVVSRREAPETGALAWGAYMGMTESTVFDMTSAALEGALSEGRFSPRSKGWKKAQAEVMRLFLTTPLHSLDERTPARLSGTSVRSPGRNARAVRSGKPSWGTSGNRSAAFPTSDRSRRARFSGIARHRPGGRSRKGSTFEQVVGA